MYSHCHSPAPPYYPFVYLNDLNSYVYDSATAVSPKYAKPFYLRMYLQRRRSASDTQHPCRNASFDFQNRPTLCYLVSLLSHRIPLHRAETTSWLLFGLRIGAGGHEDVVGMIRSCVRAAETTTAAFGAWGRRMIFVPVTEVGIAAC